MHYLMHYASCKTKVVLLETPKSNSGSSTSCLNFLHLFLPLFLFLFLFLPVQIYLTRLTTIVTPLSEIQSEILLP